jgi:hypothetical protein
MVQGRRLRPRTTRRVRAWIIAAACGLVAACAATPASASGPVWTAGAELGLPSNAHPSAPDAALTSVACPMVVGSCAAAGTYTDDTSAGRALVAEEAAGPGWRSSASALPGDADGGHPDPRLLSIACGAAGSCSAVGHYARSGDARAMIASRAGGGWQADELALPAGAGATPYAGLTAVACGAAGACGAIGFYEVSGGSDVPMAAAQVGGAWSAADAIVLPAGAATTDPLAALLSVACGGAGTCVAVGAYEDASGAFRPMATVLSGGTWAPAVQIALPADAHATTPDAVLSTVACPASDICIAGGSYRDSGGAARPLVASLGGGSWASTALALPAGAAAHPDTAEIDAIACGAVGSCGAVGTYADTGATPRTMVASQIGGSWGAATRLALPADADQASAASSESSIACGAAGACVLVAPYVDASGNGQRAMTAAQVDGAWSAASTLPLPADAHATLPDAFPDSVACAERWSCVAVGSYTNTSGSRRVLLATAAPAQDNAPPTPAPAGTAGTPAPVTSKAQAAARPVLAVKTARFAVSKGAVRVKLACREARCSGTIKLTTAKGRRVVLAKGTYGLARGKSKTIVLRLTRSGRKAFEHSRVQPVHARLVIAIKGARTLSRAITVH